MKKMNFEFLVEYIENDDFSIEIASEKLNQFIYEEFKDINIKEYENLFYILIAINIKDVNLNEFSRKIYSNILEFYKSNNLKLGLQIIKWYKNYDNIRKCIDMIMIKTNHTMKESNIDLLNYLVEKDTYSETKKELVDYLMEYVSNIEIFDFDIYKEMMSLENNIGNRDSLNKYIFKTCKKINVYVEYIDKCINEKLEFNYIDSLVALYLRTNWNGMELEKLFDSKMNESGKYVKKNKYIDIIENECKINNIDFYNTVTCKAILYNYIFKYGTLDAIDRKIIECVLCDFAKGIELQKGIDGIHNFVEIDDEMTITSGRLKIKKNKRMYVLLKENLIKDFSKDNIKILETIYHEIEHAIQENDIKDENWSGNRFKMYIEEKILMKKIKNYNELNYYTKYTEIEARYAGAIHTKELIESLGLDWNKLYLKRDGNEENALMSLNARLEECENLLKEADFKYIDDNRKKENIMEYYEKINHI